MSTLVVICTDSPIDLLAKDGENRHRSPHFVPRQELQLESEELVIIIRIVSRWLFRGR